MAANPAGPEIIVRADLDASGLERGTRTYASALKRMEQDALNYERQMQQFAKNIDRAFALTESAAERFAKTMDAAMGRASTAVATGTTRVNNIPEQDLTSASPQARVGGFENFFERIHQYEALALRTREAAAATKELEVAETGAADTGDKTVVTNRNIMQSLRSLRWELVTIMFMWRLVARAAQAAIDEINAAAETAGAGRGVGALATAYGESADAIVASMKRVSEGAVDNATVVKSAQEALMIDHGRFAAVYDEVWRSAQLTAAVSGRAINEVYSDMISALDALDAAALDSIAPLADADLNMRKYAVSVGKTVDQLTDYERAQSLVASVQQNTNGLVAAGAQDIIDSTKAWDQATTFLGNYKEALFAMIADMQGAGTLMKAVLDELQAAFDNLLGRAAVNIAQLNTYLEILSMNTADIFKLIQEGGLKAFGEMWDDRFVRNLANALNIAADYTQEYTGATNDAAIASEDFAQSQEELRLQLVEMASSGLQRAMDAVVAYEQRVERATRQYNTRLEDMALDLDKDLARIDKDADKARERAIRAAQQRQQALIKQNNDRIAQMQEEHSLQMLHNRQRFDLEMLNNEAMYLYQRGKYVAEGDVLAAEDLDAMYELQKAAKEREFELSQAQAEATFQLQLKYARMAAEEQARILRESLQEQLAEIEARRREDKSEREETYQEQLAVAKKNYEDQLAELEEALNDQLESIGRGLQDQLATWSGGYNQVVDVIRGIFGPGGTADAIIAGFMDRTRNIRIQLQTYITTGTVGGGGRYNPGDTPYPRGPYQYGGDFFATSPSTISVGEVPERVQITPMNNLGGRVSVGWDGDPIGVVGSGEFGGADMNALAQRLTQEIFVVVRDVTMRRYN